MDTLELILMEEQAVQIDEASERVLMETPQLIPMQEEMAKVD